MGLQGHARRPDEGSLARQSRKGCVGLCQLARGAIIVGVANDFTRVGLADAEHLDTTAIRRAIEKYGDGDFVVVAAEHVVAEEGEAPKRFGIVHFLGGPCSL